MPAIRTDQLKRQCSTSAGRSFDASSSQWCPPWIVRGNGLIIKHGDGANNATSEIIKMFADTTYFDMDTLGGPTSCARSQYCRTNWRKGLPCLQFGRNPCSHRWAVVPCWSNPRQKKTVDFLQPGQDRVEKEESWNFPVYQTTGEGVAAAAAVVRPPSWQKANVPDKERRLMQARMRFFP